jgi:hypothetical protein
MRRTNLTAAVTALALAACGGGDSWTGTVTDSAGVAIVENPATGMWSSSSQWSLEQELKIGSIEGDPEYQFGQVGFIAVDSRDRMFVIDAQAQEIRVFSPDGEYVQTIGRPGSGPGELGPQAITLYMGPGDTLLVPDLGQQRVNRYAADGTSLGSFRLALENGLPMAINATRSGVIVEQVRPLSLPDRPATDSMDMLVQLGTDGSVLDTLKRFPPGGTINLANPNSPEVTVFTAEPVWQIANDMTLCFGVSDEYSIGMYSPDGTLERVIRKPFEVTPITERDQEMMWTFFEEQLRANVPPQAYSEAIQRMRSVIHFADHYPIFAGVQFGPNKSVWVQHIQSPSGLSEEQLKEWNFIEDIGSPDWDVFDAQGRYLGVVTMPARFAPRAFVDNKIYGVWRDELDVQYVTRMRIVGVDDSDTGAIELGASR